LHGLTLQRVSPTFVNCTSGLREIVQRAFIKFAPGAPRGNVGHREPILRFWVTTPALQQFTTAGVAYVVRFEKISFLLLWKRSSLSTQRWCCSCKFKSRRIGSWGEALPCVPPLSSLLDTKALRIELTTVSESDAGRPPRRTRVGEGPR
jgi:hypothetical protein